MYGMALMCFISEIIWVSCELYRRHLVRDLKIGTTMKTTSCYQKDICNLKRFASYESNHTLFLLYFESIQYHMKERFCLCCLCLRATCDVAVRVARAVPAGLSGVVWRCGPQLWQSEAMEPVSAEAVIDLAELVLPSLSGEHQHALSTVIELVRRGQARPSVLTELVRDLKRQAGSGAGYPSMNSTAAPSFPSTPTPSEACGGGCGKGAWEQPFFGGWENHFGGGFAQTGWSEFQGGQGYPIRSQQLHFPEPPPGMSLRTAWRGGVTGKGKGKGKGWQFEGGKGKGWKGKGKGKRHFDRQIMAGCSQEAEAALAQFRAENPDFVFNPRALTQEVVNLFFCTGEHKLNLLKNMNRHLSGNVAALKEILREMIRESHWPVDRLNNVERHRQEKNQWNDGRSAVSAFTNRTGSTTRRRY